MMKSRDMTRSFGTTRGLDKIASQTGITDIILEDVLIHSQDTRNKERRAAEDLKSTLHNWSKKKSN